MLQISSAGGGLGGGVLGDQPVNVYLARQLVTFLSGTWQNALATRIHCPDPNAPDYQSLTCIAGTVDHPDSSDAWWTQIYLARANLVHLLGRDDLRGAQDDAFTDGPIHNDQQLKDLAKIFGRYDVDYDELHVRRTRVTMTGSLFRDWLAKSVAAEPGAALLSPDLYDDVVVLIQAAHEAAARGRAFDDANIGDSATLPLRSYGQRWGDPVFQAFITSHWQHAAMAMGAAPGLYNTRLFDGTAPSFVTYVGELIGTLSADATVHAQLAQDPLFVRWAGGAPPAVPGAHGKVKASPSPLVAVALATLAIGGGVLIVRSYKRSHHFS